MSIKFNNEQIPDSPFIVPIATLSDEARRLTVTSLQVKTGLNPCVNREVTDFNECELVICSLKALCP